MSKVGFGYNFENYGRWVDFQDVRHVLGVIDLGIARTKVPGYDVETRFNSIGSAAEVSFTGQNVQRAVAEYFIRTLFKKTPSYITGDSEGFRALLEGLNNTLLLQAQELPKDILRVTGTTGIGSNSLEYDLTIPRRDPHLAEAKSQLERRLRTEPTGR